MRKDICHIAKLAILHILFNGIQWFLRGNLSRLWEQRGVGHKKWLILYSNMIFKSAIIRLNIHIPTYRSKITLKISWFLFVIYCFVLNCLGRKRRIIYLGTLLLMNSLFLTQIINIIEMARR